MFFVGRLFILVSVAAVIYLPSCLFVPPRTDVGSAIILESDGDSRDQLVVLRDRVTNATPKVVYRIVPAPEGESTEFPVRKRTGHDSNEMYVLGRWLPVDLNVSDRVLGWLPGDEGDSFSIDGWVLLETIDNVNGEGVVAIALNGGPMFSR